ncbi:MAG TPA: class I SAM-dependent methyltransferase [Blastocatellia bacterium]|jgi:SAM-dependent methyltransferase|nr:class I SAM-dependent methyltransferase [Blastocatellia bacterium]
MNSTSAIKESAGLSLEIQSRLSDVDRYNEWIFEQFRPYVGRRVLDVGCAIGNITQYLLDREFVCGIDVVEEFTAEIRKRFADRPNFKAALFDIADPAVTSLASENIDSIISVNVLEHVEDDLQALENINRILKPGGKLLLLVPALQWLYGTMDAADNHYRRYNKRRLRERISASGFSVERVYYMNLIGIVGWFVNGKILKNDLISTTHYSLYNRIVPVISKVESLIHPPIGLSLVAIATKR